MRGLEGFSHLWLIFVFHLVDQGAWTPTVRPPRLGGNRRMGVFATRSPFRPSPLGLSVVSFDGIEKRGDQWLLKLSGIDLVDGTPVVDIKPYLSYVDAIPAARAGFTGETEFIQSEVSFNNNSDERASKLESQYPHLKTLIRQVIGQQPQPAYHGQGGNRVYGMTLYNLNIRWQWTETGYRVIAIEKIDGTQGKHRRED